MSHADHSILLTATYGRIVRALALPVDTHDQAGPVQLPLPCVFTDIVHAADLVERGYLLWSTVRAWCAMAARHDDWRLRFREFSQRAARYVQRIGLLYTGQVATTVAYGDRITIASTIN